MRAVQKWREGKVFKPGQTLLIDVFGGKVVAYVFNDNDLRDHKKEVPVPPELAGQICKWAEEVAPDISLKPDPRGPDCVFNVVEREET